MITRKVSLLRTLIILTAMFFLAQIVLADLSWNVNTQLTVVYEALSNKYILIRFFLLPLTLYFLAQFILYALLVFYLWYVTVTLAELFSLSRTSAYYLGLLLWLDAVMTILFLNAYFVPHSFFSSYLLGFLLHDSLSPRQVSSILYIVGGISVISSLLALLNMVSQFLRKQHRLRHGVMLLLLTVFFIVCMYPFHFVTRTMDAGSADKPNIIFIGFDALRPDYLSFFNSKRVLTPGFDAFLRSATVFADAYTPEARTSPSWAGILTGRYPLHNGLRENNINLAALNFSDSLPAILQKSGYETIYATDDRLFNIIDHRFGFDQVIGSDGTITDFLYSALNDFPLSNLLIPTSIGKMFFPYNHANHSSAHTYNPDNFVEAIIARVNRAGNKPVFLAVHFDLTAWPHYWFNDGMAADASTQALYANSIKGSDTLLTKFLALLARDKLLNHAIVIVLSDHGIGLGMPGDRAIQKDKFIGSRYDMRVTRYMYAVPLKNESFGIDTSYGYGGDVLSYNRQNQVLLAIKGYGFNTGTPHIVRERALTLDVAPTILDLLQLRGLRHADGLSWKPSLLASGYHLPARRDIYLESAMTSGDLTRKDINVSSVIAGVKNYFKINPDDGKVDLLPAILKQEIGLKQRVIIDGEWMLAYYPVSEKSEFIKVMNSASTSARKLKTVTVPPFFVLLNLRTGEWTTESTSTLAKSISIKKLNKKIDLFYGQEMAAYSGMQK